MTTCVENLSCLPSKPLEVFDLYFYQYGIPTSVIFGLLVGIFVVAIYLRTRSLAHLTVLGIYSLVAFSAMWVSDTFLEEQYRMAIYILALAFGSVLVVMVLKLVKE